MNKFKLNSIPRKKGNVVVQKVGDELVLVPIKQNVAEMDSLYSLNEVGAFIWELIDGTNSIRDISKNIVNRFEVKTDTAEKDTLEFLKSISNFVTI